MHYIYMCVCVRMCSLKITYISVCGMLIRADATLHRVFLRIVSHYPSFWQGMSRKLPNFFVSYLSTNVSLTMYDFLIDKFFVRNMEEVTQMSAKWKR